jgi:hypothetical protein
MAQKWFYQEKIEYLRYGSSKGADFLTSNKGIFNPYILEGNSRDLSIEV